MSVKTQRRVGGPDASDEVARLRGLLADAQAALHAIRYGEVDAVVVESERGPRVYTLEGASFDYRTLIESMSEGALVLTRGALILYANAHFARMVERPLTQLMGCSLYDLLPAADRVTLRRLMKRCDTAGGSTEVLLRRPLGSPMPARISIQRFPHSVGKHASIGMVVSDLSELRRREDLLRRFSHGLMQLQETERVQISTDLGENISQLLCCTLMRCQAFAEKLPSYENAFRAEVLEFARLLRTTASEVQRISTDLRPHGLEILGLAAALRGVVAEHAERMDVSIAVSCVRLSARLPARTELALYRVLQEALRNVERHSQAQHVSVTLKRRGPFVRLTVKDDGIGFDVGNPRLQEIEAGRFGLLSMRERAAAVGGTLEVTSSKSLGTQVNLSVPAPPPTHPRKVREVARSSAVLTLLGHSA